MSSRRGTPSSAASRPHEGRERSRCDGGAAIVPAGHRAPNGRRAGSIGPPAASTRHGQPHEHGGQWQERGELSDKLAAEVPRLSADGSRHKVSPSFLRVVSCRPQSEAERGAEPAGQGGAPDWTNDLEAREGVHAKLREAAAANTRVRWEAHA